MPISFPLLSSPEQLGSCWQTLPRLLAQICQVQHDLPTFKSNILVTHHSSRISKVDQG